MPTAATDSPSQICLGGTDARNPWSFCIAPMMGWSTRYARYLWRLIAPSARMYTEMIHCSAVIHGNRNKLLGFDCAEHPIAVQLGGSDPNLLAEASRICEQWGYDEINLNVGCPSPRVKSGGFGASLMLDPEGVARCLETMKRATSVAVTLKCRLGVDDQDTGATLDHFIETIAGTGVTEIIVHARKAWLSGISPKDNRNIPPLDHQRVHQLAESFPGIRFVVNGSVNSSNQRELAPSGGGVMIGRMAWKQPWQLREIELAHRAHSATQSLLERYRCVTNYADFAQNARSEGTPLNKLTAPLSGLYFGVPQSNNWRRMLASPSTTFSQVVELASTLADYE